MCNPECERCKTRQIDRLGSYEDWDGFYCKYCSDKLLKKGYNKCNYCQLYTISNTLYGVCFICQVACDRCIDCNIQIDERLQFNPVFYNRCDDCCTEFFNNYQSESLRCKIFYRDIHLKRFTLLTS